MSDYRFIIFDTETTGVDVNKQAVEVAMLELDENLTVLGEASSLIKPTIPINAEAQAVHGIGISDLINMPTIDEWVEQTFGGKLLGKVALIGHKISFDRPLFAPIGDAVIAMDTLIHAQVIFPDAPNHKLDTLKEYLGLDGGGESHRAMADVWTCYQLLQRLVEKSGRSLEALATVEKIFIHRMLWGKHTGKPLTSIPKQYRDWLLSKDIDPHLRYSLEEVGKLDIALPKPRGPSGSRIVIPKRSI